MRILLGTALLFLVSLTKLGRVESTFNCLSYDSNMGATFDLNELHRVAEQPPYQVEDGDLPCTKNIEKNYTYMFNICGTVPGMVPRNCRGVLNFQQAGALQIDTKNTIEDGDDWCYVVGRYSETSTELTLLDTEDPSKGLLLTYAGDYCGSGQQRIQRKFKIELQCADRLNGVPTHALEYEHCIYTVTMPSVYGCPLECPVANRHLCGGNGHCAYDEDKGSARCYCNHGYSGKDCSSSSSDSVSYSPALLGLIITLFIIVTLLGVSIAFMIRQLNAYKEDLAHYHVLKGSDEDSAAV